MVKLGFIVEGATEKHILENSDFFDYLAANKVNFVDEIIDAGGNGNLLPKNIAELTDILLKKGANKIFILTDLDDDICITETKNRISAPAEHIVIVSVKEIESWFLADSIAIQSLLNDSNFTFEKPEEVIHPFEEIKRIRISKIGRGLGDKMILAKLITKHHKFSILNAAKHKNCNSAKYFMSKINSFIV